VFNYFIVDDNYRDTRLITFLPLLADSNRINESLLVAEYAAPKDWMTPHGLDAALLHEYVLLAKLTFSRCGRIIASAN
jgi:hypothetical protein